MFLIIIYKSSIIIIFNIYQHNIFLVLKFLGLLFWYCEIQDFHTFLGLCHLDPHQGSALDLSGAYRVPRPTAMLSNDLRSLHILSKTRLSIPHLLGGGLGVFCRGRRKFFDTSSAGKLHPPTHDTSLIKRVKIAYSFLQSVSNQFHVIILSLPM